MAARRLEVLGRKVVLSGQELLFGGSGVAAARLVSQISGFH